VVTSFVKCKKDQDFNVQMFMFMFASFYQLMRNAVKTVYVLVR